MALSRGLADKRIIDAINANTEALEGLEPADIDVTVAALIEDDTSDVHAALVALIAAETA